MLDYGYGRNEPLVLGLAGKVNPAIQLVVKPLHHLERLTETITGLSNYSPNHTGPNIDDLLSQYTDTT
jgi:hypothetical protein